jgi:hypothetical protein
LDPLTALVRAGLLEEEVAIDVDAARNEAFSVRRDCLVAGDSADWKDWDAARDDYEGSLADALAPLYSAGFVRIGRDDEGGVVVVRAEGEASRMAAIASDVIVGTAALSERVSYVELPISGRSRRPFSFGGGVGARADRESDPVWAFASRASSIEAPEWAVPPACALVLKLDERSARMPLRHSRAVLDHVLIEYGAPVSEDLLALDGLVVEAKVTDRRFTDRMDVLTLDVDGARDPSGLLRAVRCGSGLCRGTDGVPPALLVVSLPDGVRRSVGMALRAALDGTAEKRHPTMVKLRAELLLLTPPSDAELAWLSAKGARTLRQMADYAREARARSERFSSMPPPKAVSWSSSADRRKGAVESSGRQSAKRRDSVERSG